MEAVCAPVEQEKSTRSLAAESVGAARAGAAKSDRAAAAAKKLNADARKAPSRHAFDLAVVAERREFFKTLAICVTLGAPNAALGLAGRR